VSRDLSDELLSQLNAQDSEDPLLTLITVTHDDIETPLRFVNNTENITSRSNVFTAFSFSVGLPADDGQTLKQVQIQIDNTSLELISSFRSITTPLTATVEFVLASDPDTVQLSIDDLTVRSMNYDQSLIRLVLSVDDIMNTALTSEEYSPSLYRGLF